MLEAELRSGRSSHAYLLTGHDAGRLRAAAMLLAQSLCCRSRGANGPCGSCRNCQEIDRGVYPDLSMEGPRLKLAEVKEQLALLAERPVAGARRVVVLADAHAMTREAQNALLKTLEEPPSTSVLILLARSSEGILPTVVSRCRLIPVGAAGPEEISGVLQEQGLAPAEAMFAALAAGDDLAAAGALAQREDLAELRADAVRFVCGALGPTRLPPLELVDRHQARLSSGEATQIWLACASAALRAIIAAGAGDDTYAIRAFTAVEAQALGEVLSLDAARMVDSLEGVRQAVSRHAGARLALEAAILLISG